MTQATDFVSHEWHRLSAWSILHFAQKAIVENLQWLILGGGPAAFGATQWDAPIGWWIVPVGILATVLLGAVINYVFYAYRVLDDSIQIRRGALFRKHLDLSFRRIQNVSVEHPFYFRPLGRVTLKIDGAGAKEEEVSIAALEAAQAEAARDYIARHKHRLDGDAASLETSPSAPADRDAADGSSEERFFDRSLSDLVIHGLTNNRSFIAIAGFFAFFSQSGLSPAVIATRLGIDFDVVIGGLSLVQMAILIVVALLGAAGIVALLSVLVSVSTYYGFSMYRTADSLTIRRGLLTKHEIHVAKSRIQTIQLRQDWLDRLLGRRNVILERITHSHGRDDPWGADKKRIFVPSVRVRETAAVTDEILPGCRVDELEYTPVNIRYLYKRAALASAAYLAALVASVTLAGMPNWLVFVLLGAWPLHLLFTYLSWKRGGLAIEGDVVVARSGTIGIDYRLFAADKIQDVTHIQSVLMRRHAVSSLRFHTASTTIKVPYMATPFMCAVVDYCVYRVESSANSWA